MNVLTVLTKLTANLNKAKANKKEYAYSVGRRGGTADDQAMYSYWAGTETALSLAIELVSKAQEKTPNRKVVTSDLTA